MPKKDRAPAALTRPKRCAVCRHLDRVALDQAILTGTPRSQVARQYRLRPDAVARHARQCLRFALYPLERDFETRRIAGDREVLTAFRVLLQEACDTLSVARTAEVACNCSLCQAGAARGMAPHRVTIPNLSGRLGAIRECRETLRSIARITGEEPSPTVQAWLVNLGFRDEREARQARELLTSGDRVTLSDALSDALELLNMVARERPETVAKVREWIARQSVAEEVA